MRRLISLALFCFIQPALAEDWLYLTYPGDTPLKIGKEYLNNPADWDKLLKVNKIANPRSLPVNTRIRIPVELLKVTPAPVEVTHVEGNVRIKPEGGAFRKLAIGDKLTGGENVITGPNSFAGFKLADGTKLTQQGSSKLTFGRLAAYGKTGMVSTELNLEGGRIEAGASKQIGPAGGFKVKTPVAVAGLRGTAFRLNLSEDGKTLRNEVLEGAVGIAGQGHEVLVGFGQGTIAEQGKPPEPARALLPAPSNQGLPAQVVNLPLSFAWSSQEGSTGWRAQIAADVGFQKILLDSQIDKPEVHWVTTLPDGPYFLRLRAIDAAGLEGLNTDHPFELAARPLPPELLTPGAGERSYRDSVAFTWSAAENAKGYLLQIAKTSDFSPSTAILRRLDAVNRQSERLAPGEHFWRMASLDDQGQPRGWSPTRNLRVQPLPGAPKAEARLDNGKSSFSWSAVPDAASYELEVARRYDFIANSFEARQQTRDTRTSVALKPGKYFWRIRALEADGQVGAWSRPNSLIIPPEVPYDIRVNVREGVLQMNWQGSAPAYRLEFARDANFTVPLFNHLESDASTRLATPEPGQYWVRVIALSQTGARSGRSKPVSFIIRRWQ